MAMAQVAAEPFLTLSEMRDAHNVLSTRYRSQPADRDVLEDASAFVRRGSASGRLLDTTSDRLTAQNMLDYWATVLYRSSGDSSEATLAEFEADRSKTLEDAYCPYPGVQPFQEAARIYFHGRGRLLSSVLTALESEDVIALVGESGVGKTSLLHAGVLPRLKDRGSSERGPRLFLPVVVPGEDPLGNLARAISGRAMVADRVQHLLADEGDLARWLSEVAPEGAVLSVDGLEELFSLCGDADARRAFGANVVHLARQHGSHLVILTIRSAWRTDLAELPALSALVNEHEITVPPLSGSELLEAIQGPAARVGLTFQEGLANAIARDFLNEPPAFLQLALTNLWQKREGKRVSWEAYAAMGRGRSVVRAPAEALGAVAGSGDEETVRTILLALLQPGNLPGEVRAARVERSQLLRLGEPEVIGAKVDQLVASGLLRASESNTPGDVRVEWIHDVLRDAVPVVGRWLHERELREAKELANRERERADREASLKRKATTRAWVSAVAGVAALLLAFLTLQQLSRREVLLLVSGADRVAQTNPDLALALAAHALSKAPGSQLAAGAVYKAFFESATRRVFPDEWAPDSKGVAVTGVAITSDGRTALTGDRSGRLTIWDLQTGGALWSAALDPSADGVRSVAISPAGDLAMSGAGDGSIVLWEWDGRTGKRRDEFRHHEDKRITSLAFSSDGQRAASASTDNTVWIWDRSSSSNGRWRELGAGRDRHRSDVTAVVFSPDGRLLFSSEKEKGAVFGWNLQTMELIGRFTTAETAEVTSLAINPTGCLLLSGASDGILRVRNLSVEPALSGYLGRECHPSGEPTVAVHAATHDDLVTSVAFDPEGRYAISGSEDRSVTLWRVEGDGLERLRTFRGHQGRVESVAFPPGHDTFLSSSADGSFRVWDLQGILEVGHFQANGPVTAVGATADGRIALAAALGTGEKIEIDRWDVDTGEPRGTSYKDHLDRLAPVIDRRARVLTLTDRDVAVWDFSGESEVLQREYSGVRPDTAALSEKETAAWISITDWQPTFADLETDERQSIQVSLRDEWDDKAPFAMALSADGRWLAVGTQTGRVKLFDTRSRDEAPQFPARHTGGVGTLAFRPGASVLASGSRDGTIILWDFEGRELRRLRGHTNEVRALAFSPDGRMLLSGAVGSEGCRLLLWHVDSGMLVFRFDGYTDRVRSVAISENGLRAVSGSDDGIVRVWRLPGLDETNLLESIRMKRWTRQLTAKERAEFGVSRVLEPLRLEGSRQWRVF